MECLLRKIGIDDAEFTAGDGVGRVQLYRGAGGGGVAGSSSAYEFWSNEAKMSTYDVVINACECMPFTDVAGETDDAVDWTPGGQCNVGPNFIDDTFPKVKRSRSG